MVKSTQNGSNTVRRHRRSLDMTQAELSDAVGVSRQTIVSVEGGDYAPSVFLALRLAVALNISVERLFSLDQPSAPPHDTRDQGARQ